MAKYVAADYICPDVRITIGLKRLHMCISVMANSRILHVFFYMNKLQKLFSTASVSKSICLPL